MTTRLAAPLKAAFVVLCAAELAMLVNVRLEANIPATSGVDFSRLPARVNALAPLADYDRILEKNVFDSEYIWDRNTSANEAVSVREYTLVGTVAWDTDHSQAVIRTHETGTVDVYRIGDKLSEGATLTGIERRRVTVVWNDGRTDILELPETAVQEVEPIQRNATVGVNGVKKIGDDTYAIDQEFIGNALANPAQLMRGAFLAPSLEKGRIVGFKITRIRNGSLYQNLGLESGDVIHRLNGREINGPEAALVLFTELRNADRFSLDLTRGGERRSFSYDVR
ncbi:MAG: hypothetical protein H6685_03040 [Deltaproteobacteria bacterium]|nr:hypothetical protein [Deltaproteobacteria bacterium]